MDEEKSEGQCCAPDESVAGASCCNEQAQLGASLFTNPVDLSHKYTDVFSDDYIGPGKAHHHYEVRRKNNPIVMMRFYFQDGPINDAGINGIMDENLLAIVIDRLRGFQTGPYACRENAIALTKLEESLMWLRERTRKREARGVEGTHKI